MKLSSSSPDAAARGRGWSIARRVVFGTLLGAAACSGTATPTTVGESVSATGASGGTSSGASGGSAKGTSTGSGTTTGTTSTGGSSSASGSGDASTSGGSGGATRAGDASTSSGSSAGAYGPVVMGVYNIGPVVWSGGDNNACSPYTAADETVIGSLLGGLSEMYNGDASLCDACVHITTNLGKSVTVHVVTSGVQIHPGDIDLSPDAYNLIYGDDPTGTPDYPRPMSWTLVPCAVTGNISYQFNADASQWWTSLWVRNPRVAVTKLEVTSANHPTWFPFTRQTDGSLYDENGVGAGAFDVRVTGENGATVTDHFDSVPAGMEVVGSGQL